MRSNGSTNSKRSMKLWTCQTRDFVICRDHVDLSKSYFHNNAEGIPQKYTLVHNKLNTTDIVWCFTVMTEWKGNQNTENPKNNRVLWVLDVPISEIACFVDEWLADRLLSNKPCPDIATWRFWRREASNLHPERPDRQEDFISKKLEGYTGPMLESKDGWRGLLSEEPEVAKDVSALLRCPINPHWVIKCPAETNCAGGSSCQR